MLSAPAAPEPTAMQTTARHDQADQRREYHERHHPRLHQRQEVFDLRQGKLGSTRRGIAGRSEFEAVAHQRHLLPFAIGTRHSLHRMRGSTSNW
jgi:hypothetical protein